jgi:outer membrane receptor protein involved in Fe transport
LQGRLYAGTRELDNKLSTPLAAQLPPASSGGIVSFDRVYSGAALQLARRFDLGGTSVRLLAGVEYDRMDDDRQGYINNAGERGMLRRDEDDFVYNTDALLQATFDFGSSWSAVAGVRASRVRFDTRDRYIAPGNPDDSGTLDYHSTNPVGGVTWRASPDWNVYVNAGRGFETPTFTELAYRNDGSGLNTELKASRSDHFEAGTKWRPAHGHAFEAALFDIRTKDEIVVDTNVGGRSTFRNAGGTTRRGVEAMYQAAWSPRFRTYVSYNRARRALRQRQPLARHARAQCVRRGRLSSGRRLARGRGGATPGPDPCERCERRSRAVVDRPQPARRSTPAHGSVRSRAAAAPGQCHRPQVRGLGDRERGQSPVLRARAGAPVARCGDGALPLLARGGMAPWSHIRPGDGAAIIARPPTENPQ